MIHDTYLQINMRSEIKYRKKKTMMIFKFIKIYNKTKRTYFLFLAKIYKLVISKIFLLFKKYSVAILVSVKTCGLKH